MYKTLHFFRMAEKALEKPETKTCEACGKEFGCGANRAECWCFAVDLSAETLVELRENFKKCLCRNCLLNLEFSQNSLKSLDNGL
jgi:hypothetical protein